MSSICVKNIGPVKDTGVINLTPVMLLIGKQSTGKSTLMKILCFCTWIEKKVMTEGEELLTKYTHYGRFVKELKIFHHLDDVYFSNKSEIHFDGDCIKIDLKGDRSNAKIVRKSNYATDRYNTKICFVPSERNMVSAVKNVIKAYKASDYDALYNYLWEYDEARSSLSEGKLIEMPFDKTVAYHYDDKNDQDLIYLRKLNHSIKTIYASSGVQSAIPILVILEYLTSIIGLKRALSPKEIANAVAKAFLGTKGNPSDTPEVDLSKISQLIYYSNYQLYIEEIEQNLFPQSQSDMVFAVLKSIKEASSLPKKTSRIVMTTHSPYVLTTLNLIMKASRALRKSASETVAIVGEEVIIPSEYVSAYWINDEGCLEDIIDREYGFIMGDQLDMISDDLSEKTAQLDDIIYG